MARPKKGSSAAPTKPRKTKTAEELRAELAKAQVKLKELEQRAYASQLADVLTSVGIKGIFDTVKKEVPDASEVAILAAIGKACGVQRLSITQSAATKRKPKSK